MFGERLWHELVIAQFCVPRDGEKSCQYIYIKKKKNCTKHAKGEDQWAN